MRKLSCEIDITSNPFSGRVLSAWKHLVVFGIGFSAPSVKQKTFTFIFFFFLLFAVANKTGLGQTVSATWLLTANGTATVSGNVTANDLSVGSGVGGNIGFHGTYGAYGQRWNSASLNLNDYYQFTISPVAGSNILISQIQLTHFLYNSGILSASVYYSFNSSFSSPVQVGSDFSSSASFNTDTFSGLSIPVSSGQTLYVRVYGWGANNNLYFTNKDVTISGSVTTPTLAVSPTNLNLGYTTSGTNSSVMSYNLSGFNLDGTAVSIVPPAGFEVSLSSAGPWTNSSASLVLNYSGSTLAATPVFVRFSPTAPDTDYSGDIINDDNGSAADMTVAVIGTSLLSYCSSYGNTDYDDGVTLVKFNTIDNSSVKPSGYSDYTGISTDVLRGNSYDLTVNVNTDGNYTNSAIAWIDWNQDGNFDVSTEQYILGNATNTADGATSLSPLAITIPTDAALGSTRMRVSTQYAQQPTSCNEDFDGEVEDYTINVTSPCSNPTLGGTIAAAQNICSGDNPAAFTSSVAASGHTGTLEYKWQYSTSDSPYDWQETGVTGLTYDDDTNLTDDRWYQRLARVDCESDWSGAVASNVLKVTVSPLPTATVNSISSSICEQEDAEFTITGTPGAEVTYNINGSSDITASLTGGSLTIDYLVEIGDGNQTLNLVSVKNTATSCEQALNTNATITVNPLPFIGGFN